MDSLEINDFVSGVILKAKDSVERPATTFSNDGASKEVKMALKTQENAFTCKT